jgi:D-alanyl-D-alanine carboxypeptidase/D-alanyl-D-alanine-endopeptidase (penicillin-binding protein 4)
MSAWLIGAHLAGVPAAISRGSAQAASQPASQGKPAERTAESVPKSTVVAKSKAPAVSARKPQPTRSLTLEEKIDAIVRKPSYRNAEWGIDVRSVDDNRVLYQRSSESLLPPASNVKVFTTAAALERLGPDFRFQTKLSCEGALAPDGTLRGDLVLTGGGDPDLADTIEGFSGCFVHLDSMAQKVREAGIAVIEGDIVGDDSYFVHALHGEGWTTDDVKREYGAPISALSYNNNQVTVSVRPAPKIGQPAAVATYPSSTFAVANQTKTVRKGASTTLGWYRAPGSDRVSVKGNLRVSGVPTSRSFLVSDPALFTAASFRDRLVRAGIRVVGKARSRHAGDSQSARESRLMYVHRSRPLSEIVAYTNKHSQNLFAELILRTLGAEIRGIGSDRAGLEVILELLADAGVSRSMVDLYDGSGLSRLNLVAPRAETLLLCHLATRPYFATFVNSLAISGLDGTLNGRMNHGPAAQRVFAKTGSLQSVTTLGGFVMTASGKTLAFCIMLNNHAFGPITARRAIDRICAVLAEL